MSSASSTVSKADVPPWPPHSHPRSCTTCRRRKVKCDRKQPCAICVRAGIQCVYPPGPGRAPKRPRTALDARLLDRLSRLETMIRHLERQEGQRIKGTTATSSEVNQQLQMPDDHNQGSESHSVSTNPRIERHPGRLLIDETRSCYISNSLLASMGDEIEEMRDLLFYEPPLETDSDTFLDESAPEEAMPFDANAAIMGFRAVCRSLREYHPPLSQSVALLEVFKENVAPVVLIFHIPTLVCIYWDAIASLDTLDKDTEALLFAVYYSAVISMDSEQCFSVLGVSRKRALETYHFAVQQAVARADLLNTQSMALLQAMVIFLTAFRNEDESRTVWSLTALVFHIAQAMGLHRDGTEFGLTPLETELRRRLWWHICFLDNRSSIYHGCEPIVNRSSFNTKFPLNINDSDLTRDMTKPPPEREGATEMTFCLIRCEILFAHWKICYVPPNVRCLRQRPNSMSLPEREALVQELKQRLEDHYLKHCDDSIPILFACLTTARLILAKTWLVLYYPLSRRDEANLPTTVRDQLLRLAIEVLKESTALLKDKRNSRWAWHAKAHIQWQAAAFTLSEICSRPPSAECDRAWKYITILADQWKLKKEKGTMWRPIKRLLAKTQYVRERQKACRPGRVSQWRGGGSSAAAFDDDALEESPHARPSSPRSSSTPALVPSDETSMAMAGLQILGEASDIFAEPLFIDRPVARPVDAMFEDMLNHFEPCDIPAYGTTSWVDNVEEMAALSDCIPDGFHTLK